MAKAAQSPDLKAAFTQHERETRGQVKRLDRVFKIIGKPARGKTCEAINGITEEGSAARCRLGLRRGLQAVLEETLTEEKNTDKTLTGIAKSVVNVEAEQDESITGRGAQLLVAHAVE